MTCRTVGCCAGCDAAACAECPSAPFIVDEGCLEAVSFVGLALAPFFLEDPKNGEAGASFAAMGSLDYRDAADEWPFADCTEARNALSLMVTGLAECVSDEGEFEASEDLVWEYRRLFVGPGKKPVPPWGSVYTDRDRVIFGASALALRSWMRKNGVERQQDDGMPDDHIGLMLSLMATLSAQRPDCLGDFLQNHLLTWSSHYLKQLEAEARHPFYEGLALLTRSTLEGLQREAGIEVVHPRFYR